MRLQRQRVPVNMCGNHSRGAAKSAWRSGLWQYMRTHYIQAGSGHYGVFSGRRWSHHIYPVVREVIHVSG